MDLTKLEKYFRENPIDGAEFKEAARDFELLPDEEGWVLRLIFWATESNEKLVCLLRFDPAEMLEFPYLFYIMAKDRIEEMLEKRGKGIIPKERILQFT